MRVIPDVSDAMSQRDVLDTSFNMPKISLQIHVFFKQMLNIDHYVAKSRKKEDYLPARPAIIVIPTFTLLQQPP